MTIPTGVIYSIPAYYMAKKTKYLPVAPLSHAGGTPGISLKFADGYLTATKSYRWSKPAGILSVTFEGVSGGAGGGTAGPADGEPSTGPGGPGGAYVNKTFDPVILPATVVMIAGHGGMPGGWDKAVTYPDGPNAQGWIMDVGPGGDGGHSALIDATKWDALGTNDVTRLAAFLAMGSDAKVAFCILYCSPGIAAPSINVEENVEGMGGMAFGGDINRAGNDGAGGAYWTASSDDPYYPANGIYGAGGACGSRLNNDGLWDTGHVGVGGLIGQVAGRGGTPKKSKGNHDGAWGSDLGGGGGGGQTSAAQNGRVMPGGGGGQGGWRVTCSFTG